MSNTKSTSPFSFPSGFMPPPLLSGLPQDSAVLVGLSGGADSSALLHLLWNYSKLSGAKIYAAHINHGIRGSEADRDESFCSELAKKLGIEFFSLRVNIPQIAAQTNESIETAARRIRYEYFHKLMREKNIKLLATAHNADDNLETIIFNIARGSGLSGVCGIPRIRSCAEGLVIRPILSMEKSEILEYCRQNNIDYVTDSTNTDTDYTRNKIRARIIPIMKEINSGAAKNASRMSDCLRADLLCLDEMAEQLISTSTESHSIELKKLCEASDAVASRALIRLFDRFSPDHTLELVHINALRILAERAIPHSVVSLPANTEGVIENGRLYLRQKPERAELEEYCISLFEGRNVISQTNAEIFIGPSHSYENIYKKSILLSIDSAKISGSLIARSRQGGDRIRINGMSKSVKKLMCDKKIPLELRERIPIICDGEGILAIPFLCIRDGAAFRSEKATASSKTDIHFYLI